MRVKTSGMAGGWRMPGPRAVQKFANAPPQGLTRRANAPQQPGGAWAQVELTDA